MVTFFRRRLSKRLEPNFGLCEGLTMAPPWRVDSEGRAQP